MNLIDVADTLLLEGANPLFENGHGNTPLSLLAKSKAKFDRSRFNTAVERFTLPAITGQVSEKICINGNQYEVTRIITTGECCVSVLELKSCSSNEIYILKIKSWFGGLELRNHLLLERYIDLVAISDLCLSNGQHIGGVYGLLQLYIPGTLMADFLVQTKDKDILRYVMHKTLEALHELHRNVGCVHRDALPQNIIWDACKQKIEFIDFDVLRTSADLLPQDFEVATYNDFDRLLFGDGKAKLGFSSFYNVYELIDSLEDEELKRICETALTITRGVDFESARKAKIKTMSALKM